LDTQKTSTVKKISSLCLSQHVLLGFILALSISATHRSFTEKMLNAESIEGRWDMTVQVNGRELPSWLEVTHSGRNTLVGQFVGFGGSARPISRVNFESGKFNFAIPPQWEQEPDDLKVEGTVEGDNLSGTMTMPNGKIYNYTATRAPSLRRDKQPSWGSPVKIFNGKNMDGWETTGTNQWVVESGVLKSPKSGANIFSSRTFSDFKLHIEFRYPKESNSGVYLRGRYEVQISDSKGLEAAKGELGAVYGFITPSEMAAKAPGEWQSYDITLVGRMVSVIANGKQIICNQEIPGITGGALNSKESEPGPILMQGDHGPIEFRNIIITPAK
jgi:hypothetical protein